MSEFSPPVEAISAAEAQFDRWRRGVGLALAAAAFGAVLLAPFDALTLEAHRLAAIMAAVMVLWISEAVPMPVTALLGAAACVIFRVAEPKVVFAPFADPLIFVFIGSFILARGIFLHKLDRRLAFGVLSQPWIGTSPSRILFAFGAVTAAISGWMSNTATTAMMFAIGLSILNFMFHAEENGGPKLNRRYATGMMLMTSFAASIGGLATPVGSPPNLIGLGQIYKDTGVKVSFFQWTMIGYPLVIGMFLFLFAYLNFFCSAGVRELDGSHQLLERERKRLGPWTRGQVSTVIAFGLTVTLWIMPGILELVFGKESEIYQRVAGSIPEAVAAILGAALLFLLPGEPGRRAIDWNQAAEIDWGVVFLYGGGMALGELARSTGLAAAVGETLAHGFLPKDASALLLLAAATLVATMVSEATSNTASALIVVPIAISIAQAAEMNPLEPALGATFGASLGFMLPVSTPCNAIVYGSGYIPLTRMIRYGLILDVVGTIVVVLFIKLIVPLVIGSG